jgi:hypothetical protein
MAGTDDAFRQGLQEVGWSEGRNLLITGRWGAGDNDSIRAAASDLVGQRGRRSASLIAGSRLVAKTSPVIGASTSQSDQRYGRR